MNDLSACAGSFLLHAIDESCTSDTLSLRKRKEETMHYDMYLSVFGRQFPITNPRIKKLPGGDFELSGDFRGQSAVYRRTAGIWANAEGTVVDTLFAAFFDTVVEHAARYVPG